MHALCQSMLELARWRGALGGGPTVFWIGQLEQAALHSLLGG